MKRVTRESRRRSNSGHPSSPGRRSRAEIARSKSARRWILILLLLSGSCGLIYEVLWMKLLTLVIGNTVFSITTVLTAFMGGLALGSFLGGRLLHRFREPLKTYAILEAGIGVCALLLPLAIAATAPLFRFVYQSLDPSFYTLGLLRFVVCGSLLLIPATLMGATLPVLCRYFSERGNEPGWTVGLLYGVNTSGAVLGSLIGGFFLIPTLGTTWTIYLAAFINLSIAVAAFMIARGTLIVSGAEGRETAKARKANKREVRSPAQQGGNYAVPAIMVGIGLSGLAAMIYQIAWTRVLTLSIGSSVYAFSLILTAFIFGLALGSLTIARFIDRRGDLITGLAATQAVIGIAALLTIPILGKLPVFVVKVVATYFDSFNQILWVELALVFLLLLLPTFMMGAAVPIAVRICATNIDRLDRIFGDVYAINTLGAIIGSFAAGFLLLPWIGSRNSILVAVAVNLAAAIVIFVVASNLSRSRRIAGALLLLAGAGLAWQSLPKWDYAILTSGPYLYAERYRDLSASGEQGIQAAMREGQELLFFEEGLHAVVSVKRTVEGDVALEVNGKTDATARGDAATQLMLGHLPLLMNPDATNVLIIGLGSGMTLAAAERHPVQAIDMVELEPAVIRASEFFVPFTGDVLADSRVNLIVADGRNHLALSDRQYDVIISEPSNVWVSGMANLFTQEFFELARQRLRSGGLMVQWVHAYSMASADFKMLVRTFRSVFPNLTVWEVDLDSDYLLVGSMDDVAVDAETLQNLLANEDMRHDLATMGITDLASFAGKLLMVGDDISRYTAGAALHTDANGRLEYSAPRALLQHSTRLLEELYQHRSSPPEVLRALGWDASDALLETQLDRRYASRRHAMEGYVSISEGAQRQAIESFDRALALSPEDYDTGRLLASVHLELGKRLREQQSSKEAADAFSASARTLDRLVAADGYSASSQWDVEVLRAQAHQHLGLIHLESGSLRRAERALRESLSGEVQYAKAHNNLGVVHEREGRMEEAKTQYLQALEVDPNHVSARMNLGNVYLAQLDYDKAVASYLLVQELQPDSEMAHYNLGVAYFRQGELGKAANEWTRALEIKPDFREARESLDVVQNRMKQP